MLPWESMRLRRDVSSPVRRDVRFVKPRLKTTRADIRRAFGTRVTRNVERRAIYFVSSSLLMVCAS